MVMMSTRLKREEKMVNNMKIVHVQSVLPEEDIIALKLKTGESSTKDAISTAVYYYLDCEKIEKYQ
jgi:hypothetical protein